MIKNIDNRLFFDEAGSGGQPPAGAINTGNEPMIPKSRFDEVNNALKETRSRLDAIEAERKADTEKRLAEQQEWKQIAENRAKELTEAQSKAAQVDAYHAALTGLLKAEIEELPEESRKLIPTKLPIQDQIEYIAQNRALLVKPKAPATDAGTRSGGNPPQPVELTDDERAAARAFGYTDEAYLKLKGV